MKAIPKLFADNLFSMKEFGNFIYDRRKCFKLKTYKCWQINTAVQ